MRTRLSAIRFCAAPTSPCPSPGPTHRPAGRSSLRRHHRWRVRPACVCPGRMARQDCRSSEGEQGRRVPAAIRVQMAAAPAVWLLLAVGDSGGAAAGLDVQRQPARLAGQPAGHPRDGTSRDHGQCADQPGDGASCDQAGGHHGGGAPRDPADRRQWRTGARQQAGRGTFGAERRRGRSGAAARGLPGAAGPCRAQGGQGRPGPPVGIEKVNGRLALGTALDRRQKLIASP